jgi:hypothetical protein
MLIYYSKKVEECQTKYHGFAKIFFINRECECFIGFHKYKKHNRIY